MTFMTYFHGGGFYIINTALDKELKKRINFFDVHVISTSIVYFFKP